MDPVRWLVQAPVPFDPSPAYEQLERACISLSLPFESILVEPRVVPRLPPLTGPVCVHGLRAATEHPLYRRAVFFEPARFTVDASVREWGARMLNSEPTLRSWADVFHNAPATSCFVRPNEDDKLFTGAVLAPGELRALHDRLHAKGLVSPSELLALSPPREVDAEARLFIIEGRVVGGSF